MPQSFSLLLVEPEEQQQKLIEEVLRTEFEITDIATSQSSIEAMSLLSAHGNLQCIIISSILNDSSGFSLIADIRAIEKYSRTPVLIMSDIHERDHLLKAAASGASDFIVKPFDSRALSLKLKKLLADKQFRKANRISTLEAFDVEIVFNDTTSYSCKLIDISTGGCSIKSEPFTKGGSVFEKATININDNGPVLTVLAELARIERDPECEDKEHKSQISGFQFIDPDEKTTDNISTFINNVGT
ncbi:MAG: response regulator [Gammaproteobacteria bacterium]|nr:response regulator [Gammaproteobacteria bacterium]